MFTEEITILQTLANGVNYFTGEKCDNNCILNDPSIIRALFNICEKLKEITADKIKKVNFKFDPLILEKYEFENKNLSLTDIIRKISALTPNMKKIKYSEIFEILNQKGLLIKEPDSNGSLRTKATELAQQYGIINQKKFSTYGKHYTTVVYNNDGQKFILSILNELK